MTFNNFFLQKIKWIKEFPQHQSLCLIKIHIDQHTQDFLNRSADSMLTISLAEIVLLSNTFSYQSGRFRWLRYLRRRIKL